ncbi:MAG: DnaJ C-terminal domain-containing protein [Microcoleaceae cyanobacterium MO_207.B10]|nr:DnaJ C-terminal domain-containing protein [Microcoleaceae cyanobacterium MO_207.B10]
MAATDFKDYYAALGLNKSASSEQIKKTYRKLARKYHPDMNPGDRKAEERFKEVNEAYEVLSDPEKRKKYDQFGQYWKQAGTAGSGWPGGTGGTTVDFNGFDFGQYASFDDFINSLLGRSGYAGNTGGGGRQTYYRTNTGGGRPSGFGGFDNFSGFDGRSSTASLNLEANISLTFGEAFRGTQRRVASGEVSIPPGVKSGSKIRVKGRGQVDPYTQKRGDLYLNVDIKPHSFFQFEGDNLVCDVPITPDEAVLGTSIEVPTPDGAVSVNIPAGIRSGQSLRLRGKGWPKPKSGGRTDLLARIMIAAPKNISSVERECYEKIRDNRTFDPRSHLKSVSI